MSVSVVSAKIAEGPGKAVCSADPGVKGSGALSAEIVVIRQSPTADIGEPKAPPEEDTIVKLQFPIEFQHIGSDVLVGQPGRWIALDWDRG